MCAVVTGVQTCALPIYGTVGWWTVSVKDPNQSAQIAAAIDKLSVNSPDETKSQSEKEFTQSFIKQFGDINFIVKAILGAVFFTLLFLTGNTMKIDRTSRMERVGQ